MSDVDFFEERFAGILSPVDQALIENFCEGMEEKIRLASSRKRAELIVKDACREFENLCDNEAAITFLKRKVDDWLQEFWGVMS